MIDVSYASEDAALVAELLLAAGRGHEIPAYLRRGVLPETVALEVKRASAATSAATSVPSAQRDTSPNPVDELEQAARDRFAAMRTGVSR